MITREEILHSGAHSIPEVLRLAPNLQVNQVTASNYAITGPQGQLALVGTNILHAHHQEFPGNEFIPRGYGIEARFGL